MDAVSIQKPGTDKVLASQGLASLTFMLHWSDGRVEHEDEMYVEKFSVWREADLLPAEIGAKIVGMRARDSAQATLSAGEVTDAWDSAREVSGSPARFDRAYRHSVRPGLCRMGFQACRVNRCGRVEQWQQGCMITVGNI